MSENAPSVIGRGFVLKRRPPARPLGIFKVSAHVVNQVLPVLFAALCPLLLAYVPMLVIDNRQNGVNLFCGGISPFTTVLSTVGSTRIVVTLHLQIVCHQEPSLLSIPFPIHIALR